MIPNNINFSNADRELRPTSIKEWKDFAKSKVVCESFCIDTAKLWNSATLEIKNASTIGIAKSAIKKFARTVEI